MLGQPVVPLKTNAPALKPHQRFTLETPPQADYPPYTYPERDRWRVGFSPWQRYTHGSAETPYETPVPRLWHPYKQSVLKGDVPIIGQDIFLNLTASSTTEFEARRLPTP